VAYSYVLTNAAVTGTDPAGSDFISLGDDNIRAFKSAVIERVNSFFVDVNAQPWIMKSPGGGLGNVQSVIPVTDNTYVLGTAALRWSDFRTMTATFSGIATAAAGIVFTGGSIAAGTITKDTIVFGTYGLVISGITAGTSDLTLMSPATTTILTVPTGTRNISLGGNIIFVSGTAKIIPGATSLSLRNTGDSADNLLLLDAGNATFRNTVTVSSGGVIVTAGDMTLSAGRVVLSATASKIIPGSTSLSLRNNADSADNLILTDAGAATFRAAVTVGGLATLNGALLIDGAAPATSGVSVTQVGIGGTSATTVGAAGGASALPATPTGYLIINRSNTTYKIPYYNN
jgi:hypothetical protein